MTFHESEIAKLKELIRPYVGAKRYLHTLGVETAAIRLGELLMPDRVSELRVAALLHDIAKDISYDEQLKLIRSDDSISLTDEDIETRPAAHSFAAVPLIKRDFVQYTTESVLSAVLSHTLGSPSMDVFCEIIFVADFIEETREYKACKDVAEFVYSHLDPKRGFDENVEILHAAVVKCIDSTVYSLKERGESVNSKTLATRSAFIERA